LLVNLAVFLDPRPMKDASRHESMIEPAFVLILALPAISTAFVLSMIRAWRVSVAKWKGPPDPELA
jgi:hypothetical protein